MKIAESAKSQPIGHRYRAAIRRPGITATHDWMPKSGYGPYCTIPELLEISGAYLKLCGMPSYAASRIEIMALANEYADRADALVEKARRERLRLSQTTRGPDGEPLIRPYRVRLGLIRRGHCLYLCWRGVVKIRGRCVRRTAPIWDCRSQLGPLIAEAHPAEVLLISQIETEAAEIRRRWFALVRKAHYLRVSLDHRLVDLETGRIHAGRGGPVAAAIRRLRAFLSGAAQ